jgi:hypothetical protein
MRSDSKLVTSSSSSATVGERAPHAPRSGSRARTAATSDASAATNRRLPSRETSYILSSSLILSTVWLGDKIRLLGFTTLHDTRRYLIYGWGGAEIQGPIAACATPRQSPHP